MPIRSYVRSPDFYYNPCGKNLLCGVDISVMGYCAIYALPFTTTQRQLFNDVLALTTLLRNRNLLVDLDQRPTLLIPPVFKRPDQLTLTHISDREVKFWVVDYVLHCRILACNRWVFMYQSSYQLVKEILFCITDILRSFRNFEPRCASIVRPFLLTTQRLVNFFQFATFCIEPFRTGTLFAITQSSQACHTLVNPKLTEACRQRLYFDSYQPISSLSPRRRELNRNGRKIRTLEQFLTLVHRQQFKVFSKVQLVFKLECILAEICTTAISLLLESWVLRPCLKKVRECCVQISQFLLLRNAANLIQKLKGILQFPSGQPYQSIDIANSFLFAALSFGSQNQSTVVDQMCTTHRASQQGFSLSHRIETVLESFSSHFLHRSIYSVRYIRDWCYRIVAVSSCPKTAGLLARFQ